MAFTFTSVGARRAASELLESASKIEEMLNTFHELINRIERNYKSEASREIVASFTKVRNKGPEFQLAVEKLSRYLSDTVAPEFEKLEATAQSKVEDTQ